LGVDWDLPGLRRAAGAKEAVTLALTLIKPSR
jgi:hypothetical protein